MAFFYNLSVNHIWRFTLRVYRTARMGHIHRHIAFSDCPIPGPEAASGKKIQGNPSRPSRCYGRNSDHCPVSMHLGSQLGERWLTARVDQVKAQKPDLVVLLGDIFEGHGSPEDQLIVTLKQLSAPLGIWAVSGNHEFHRGG